MNRPPPHNPASSAPAQALQIDQVCLRFKQAWQTGTSRPCLEDFLTDVPAAARSLLLRELLALELDHRRQANEPVTPEEYAGRFPDHLADVRAVFSDETPTVGPLEGSRESPPTPATTPANATVAPGPPVVPGYEILGKLGEGGMGVVYQARQVRADRLVALKMIKAGVEASPDQLRRFRNEAEAVARLQHPHIVQIHEVGEADGRPYFSLEFVEGGSLAHKLKGGALPPRQAAQLVEVVARAVHAAHQKGIVHRDLKPANILLTAEGSPKVTDFGLVKRLDVEQGQTQSGAVLGTPSYMAPEQASGRIHAIGPATDVYALGVLLYEMLTGRPPFRGEEKLGVLVQVVSEEPVAPSRRQPKVHRDLETICLKCLAKIPGKRYASALDLADDLQRFLGGEPIVARPVSRLERLVKWVRRKPLAAALGSLGALTVLFGGSLVLWLLRARAETAHAVEQDLAAAVRLCDQENWAAARTRAERAQGMLERGGGSAELRGRVRELLRDLDMVERLEEVRFGQAGFQGDSPAHTARPGSDYATAFRQYGLDVEQREPAEVASRIRGRVIKEQLTAALDDWAAFSQTRRPRQAAQLKRLVTIAGMVDPDPLRQQWRQALVREDRNGILRLARSVPTRPVPTRTLRHWALLLGTQGDSAAAVRLLQRARRQQPGDFWINYSLALYSLKRQPRQLDEALRFASAAVALRSQSPVPHRLLGTVLLLKGQSDEAIACFQEAIRLRPGDAEGHYQLAIAMYSLSRLDESIASLREATRRQKDHAQAHHVLGFVLYRQGRLDEAIVSCKEAIRLKNDAAHVSLVKALQDRGRREEASAAGRQALLLRREDPAAHRSLGQVLQALGRLDEAIASYKEAIRLTKDHSFPEAYVDLGSALHARGEQTPAIAAYREAIRLNKDNAEAHFNLGIALTARGERAAAIASYREAIRLRKDHAEAHTNLGILLRQQGRVDEAIACYREALRHQKNLFQAHHNLGSALEDRGRIDEAIACYRTAIRCKEDAGAYLSLGVALGIRGETDEAITSFQKAIGLQKDSAQAHANLGVALVKKGETARAIACFQEAIRLKKDHAEAHDFLGLALRSSGRLDEAIASFRMAITSATRLTRTCAEAHYHLGKALQEKGRLDEAIASFREAIHHQQDFPDAHHHLGIALFHRGRLDEAMVCYQQTVRLKKDHAEACYHLGLVLQTLGRLDEAIRWYRVTIGLRKDFAQAHCNLGLVLQRQGKFAEAIAALRRGHELGSKDSRWRYPSEQWARACEHLLDLDQRLPALLQGKARPASATEAIDFALLCHQYRGLHAASAHLFRAAFLARPELAQALDARYRYVAACAAALAGCGEGADALRLDAEGRRRWRQQALDWLRADLQAWQKQIENGTPAARAFAARMLQSWQQDGNLAGLRDAAGLAWLSEAERQTCRQLWADVEALLERAPR
jgi:serine/threonine-protein kinase